ncbi:hypothetical protein J3492_00310 [Psychrobacter sp. F1192]|uniref:Uncharacterized protein n=1 Tax=Psychrobacter coccoides TaxID=2818440 RepID=A0ABS3NJU4_9GAMM|nr:hypothetical protein [Psychrobacter coccoides]MBO1529656.1 hypothetical protein [Psychrobacter coccoides]
MATNSLGRLTLDLAVRLSEFTDGLTRAERETRERTDNMGGSVRKFRDQVMEDLGGTQLGSALDTLNSRLAAVSGGGMMAAGALAGMAVGGVAVAAGALAAMALETSKADVQLAVMAGTANTSLRAFQVLTHAAAGLGVEQEQLASILADTQEKLGEFSATGGGGAADFFEALQNNTSITEEGIRELGKTLQGKDGAEAIQIVKDKLDALGATSQEQRFVFESLAGDLGNLMPLFADGGVILEEYGSQLTDAGVIKTKEAIEESRKLAAQTQAIQTRFEGLKTELVAETIPALGTLINYFTEGGKEGRGFKDEVNGVGEAVRTTTGLIIALAASVKIIAQSFQAVGAQMRNIGQTYTAFVEADGVIAKSKALIGGTITSAGLMSVSMQSISDEYDRAVKAFESASAGQQGQLTGLSKSYYDTSTFLQSHSDGLAINTKEADANAKALEKQAAASGKAAKAANSATAAQARLVGISGDTGVGNAHLHIQYRDKSRAVSQSDMDRFRAGGKRITDYRKTSGFGPRNTGIKGASTNHRGTDFAVPKNTPITTNVPVAGVKTWHDSKGGGYVSTVTFEDGVVIDLLHQMPGVMGIEKGSGTGNSAMDGALRRADAMAEKAAADALRAQEQLQRKQLSIANQYATANEKIEMSHKERVASIQEAYAAGSTERAEYMAREEERYAKEKNANLLSIMDKYMSEEERIHTKHQEALKAIEAANIQDDNVRQMYVDLQNAAYKEDLANFRFAANAKAREQDKLYQSLASSMQSNRGYAASEGLDRMAQRTMGEDDYAVWRLAQDRDDTFNSVNNQYQDRRNQINATDERGEFELPELERFELLEMAKQEHMDNLWAMDQDYALKQQSLDEQLKDKRIAMQETAFGAMTDAAAMFFGENSKMHRAAFALEKAYAVQKALMNVEETYSNTYNAISAIPLVGPYIAGPMAAVAAGMQVARAAGIGGMSAPAVSGIAHGGLSNVPKESTYLLDKGERVLSPNQNSDLTKFMQDGGNQGNITINNNSSASVSARHNPDGTVTIDMVDKMIEKSFRRIGRPNSIESKSIQRHTTARVKR